MPLATRSPKADPDARYVCAIAFTSAAGDANYEEVVAGDDPRYLVAPHNFVPADTPQREWPSPFDYVVEQNEQRAKSLEQAKREHFEQASARNRVKLEPPRMYRVKHDVVALRDGQPATVLKGSVVLDGDPLFESHPDALQPV